MSLQLPKFHSKKKDSLVVERENFEKGQATCLQKAINNQETAVKEKHVRSAIIGTYQEHGASTFWDCVLRLPLQDNPIVCWKFCHVLHKVLREGHDNVLRDSQKFKHMLREHGRFWAHLKTGYGNLIKIYCNLLTTKLNFHQSNNRIPGNLEMDDEKLIQCAGDSEDAFFQMSSEMFDYLDGILELQSEIFKTMDSSRCNSMTNSGQCRLKPLILNIQDASILYDFITKILFRLHAKLSPDLLGGHRERFLRIFHGLQQFYGKTMSLQYFKNLIEIQQLPKNPPNFLVQSDLENYETRKVTIFNSEQADNHSDTLSDLVDLQDVNDSSSPDPSVMTLVLEKERIIEELRGEIERLKAELLRLQMETRNQLRQLLLEKQELRSEIQEKNEQLSELRRKLEELESKGLPEQAEQLQRAEKHIKLVEEKFGKMKDVYTGLREEHINLLRKKATVDKELVEVKKAAESQSEMAVLLEKVKQEKNEVETELSEKLKEKVDLCDTLDQSVAALKIQIEKMVQEKAEVEAEMFEKLNIKTSEYESLDQSTLQLKAQIQALESAKEEREKELKKEVELKEHQLKSLEGTKAELEAANKKFESEMEFLNGRLSEIASELSKTNNSNESFQEQIKNLQLRITDNQTNMEKEALAHYNELLDICISQCDDVVRKTVDDLENSMLKGSSGSLDHFIISCRAVMEDSILKLKTTTNKGYSDYHAIKEMVEQLPIFTHSTSSLMIHGSATSRTSADIQKGDDMLNDCRNLGNSILTLYNDIKRRSAKDELELRYNDANAKLEKLLETARSMGSSLASEANAAEVLDKELQAMEQAIEEASKKMEEILSKSRASHTGVKLEVNEKLIDSCTALMQNIRLLVQRAKSLQNEIAAQGRGSSSVKEFYKRNHQWTEGLISAAKAVGIGAKFLLESADKAVTNQGGNFEYLIASSQEIAASTIQLVVASQVRADRSSQNLSLLKQASTGVKTATAHVVATAKDCAQLIEESDELDVTKLSPHHAKRLELETQAEVLRLQSELEKSRLKLSALRQHHYHNSD